jgi:hypothetical protein
MKFEITKDKGRVVFLSGDEEERCFKCGKDRFKYVERKGFLQPIETDTLFYFCEQEGKIFCNRKDCKTKKCSKGDWEINHQDWLLSEVIRK